MQNRYQNITFSGMKSSASLLKMIRHHLQKWMHPEKFPLSQEVESRPFFVHVTKECENYYSCHIEVTIDSREWSALEEGHSVQEALLNALKHLKPRSKQPIYAVPRFYSPAQVSL